MVPLAVDRRRSVVAQSTDFRFQFLHSGFDLNPSFPFAVGPCLLLHSSFPFAVGQDALVVVGEDVPSGCRVVLRQLTMFPAQVQVQPLAETLQNSLF